MAAQALESIECSLQPLDLAFHPTKNILAAALVDGTVEFHDFTSRFTPPTALGYAQGSGAAKAAEDDDEDEDDTILSSIDVHTSEKPKYKMKSSTVQANAAPSCKAVLFDAYNNGQNLYTAGNGGTIACLDVDRASSYNTSDNSILWKEDNASPYGINILHQLPNTCPAGPLLVSGDDEGVIRLWDVRLCGGSNSTSSAIGQTKTGLDNLMQLPKGCVASFHENKDYISGFAVDTNGTTLLSSSADGTLSVIDLRKNSNSSNNNNGDKGKPGPLKSVVKSGPFHFIRKSDDQEDELLSLCLLKGGRKVVCGTQDGILSVWSWGTWGDISDRFPGHPQSIDALLKIDEDTILTGCSDGVVRIVQIHPDRLLGVLGDHDGFPVEKLKFSSEKKLVGSVSHDTSIRLWDASILTEEDIDEDDKGDSSMEDTEEASNNVAMGVAAAHRRNTYDSDGEWEDMDDSDDDSMSDDSDDSDDEMDTKRGKPSKFKTENEQFFQDL
eukprot:CAMPEP_0203667106 /NCGR_PEP_ID=MMETSP0090-20130426/4002_1 /ASSEMBLY_ACC=CAM_ASM_001088 /TAXON_ID=426623 /ORGANISM="Chaetoceros affinis, Strain CCMP159" /LENGTH=496 /DNA_ID=CAMNT_0050531165 /DNA_START=23 /DNA_END=1513 /DNA_ORIENTATION=+